LKEAASIATEQGIFDLAAIALNNRALILSKKDLLQPSILQSKQAILLSSEVHSKFSFEVRFI
jgi:hypothetical protein